MIPCPNNNACQGNTSALVTCQNITYHNQLQVRLCSALKIDALTAASACFHLQTLKCMVGFPRHLSKYFH